MHITSKNIVNQQNMMKVCSMSRVPLIDRGFSSAYTDAPSILIGTKKHES